MLISIITPTEEREGFLKNLERLLQRQSHTDWEWLIYDTSLTPCTFSDRRIRYTHSEERLTIGAKRNRLVQQAQGALIVHGDDDDYYAPTYLETRIHHLQERAFFAYYAWFIYDLKTDALFYRTTDEVRQRYYLVNALSGHAIQEISENERRAARSANGFSYAYRREVAAACAFPDCDLGEDQGFYKAVQQAGFPITLGAEERGEVIHVMHDMNTSSEYPQYRIPRFLVADTFSDFFTHQARYRED